MSDGGTGRVPGARDESLIRTLFPFFIAIDRSLRVTAVGPRWQTALPELEIGASFSDHVVIDRPTDVTEFDAISAHDGAIFMLSLAKRPLFKLRGQFVRVHGDDGADRLLFVGGPWFTNISDLSALGLTMQDFPPHDARGDFLILLQTQESTNRDLRELTARLRSQMAKQRQLEEELRQIQKMELVGRFAGGIAHNFNNILMAIHGYTALALSRAPAGEQVRNSLEQIRLATDHAAALTRALLAMSRQHPLRIESLDLRREVSELERLAKPLLGERVELVCEVHPDAGRAQADSAALKQILMNLVLNARDAMPKGGHVRIEARPPTTAPSESLRHGDFVEFLVSDDGIGMDEATKARIFEPFFTTKEVGKGVGLGLSSVYGLVEQLGGRAWSSSSRWRRYGPAATRTSIYVYVSCRSHTRPTASQASSSRRRRTRTPSCSRPSSACPRTRLSSRWSPRWRSRSRRSMRPPCAVRACRQLAATWSIEESFHARRGCTARAAQRWP